MHRIKGDEAEALRARAHARMIDDDNDPAIGPGPPGGPSRYETSLRNWGERRRLRDIYRD